MKIIWNTPLYVLGKDGLSQHNLKGLMSMAVGGTQPTEITVFTDLAEAKAAEGLQKLRQDVAGFLDNLDTREKLNDVLAYAQKLDNLSFMTPGPDRRLE